jgi:RNA polymerase sigma factor (sigma-70 family)
MTTLEPDLLLLKRFKETQDADAFSEIVRRYAGAVFSTCQRILRDPGSAEDATQETFFRLMTRPQKVTASLGGWLHRAATRLALDIRRSEISRHRRESVYVPLPPSEPANWADVAPRLDEALAALPKTHRELLVNHYLHGQSQADLAAESGTSAATLSRRMKSAMDALRQELARRGVSISPAILVTLLGRHSSVAIPAGLKIALGKMAMYCGMRSGYGVSAATKFSVSSSLRALPRVLYGARWAMAAAVFALLAALLIAMLVRHIQWQRPGMVESGDGRVGALHWVADRAR